MTERTIQLCRDMADLTNRECVTVCKPPISCCSPEYCEIAEQFAAEHGVTLQRLTDHPTLPFMGSTGCTVEPHWRPICTVHVCSINAFGFKPGHSKWTEKYFDLRSKIDEALFDEMEDSDGMRKVRE
jgi:hypothetical protein